MIDRRQLIQSFEAVDLAVRTEGLRKRYRKKNVLDGLDLRIPRGSVYALAGANGAGKTTTLRLLLGLARGDGGSGRVFGLDSWRRRAEVRAAVGYVPESHRSPHDRVPVGRLLNHLSAYRPTWDVDYAKRLIRELELRLEVPYGELSKGEARRVQLVVAMAPRLPLLLLDEPTDGLDPILRDRFLALLADHLARQETTVLISTHLVVEVELLADHLGVLAEGRLSAQLEVRKLTSRLLRYRAEVPDGVSDNLAESLAADALPVVERQDARGEVEWMVWGEQELVLAAFRAAGANPRRVRGVDLAEAVRILMAREELAT